MKRILMPARPPTPYENSARTVTEDAPLVAAGRAPQELNATHDAETLVLLEAAIEFAKKNREAVVRVIVPHGPILESLVERSKTPALPPNIRFIPCGPLSRKALQKHQGQRFLIHPAVLRSMHGDDRTEACRALVP